MAPAQLGLCKAYEANLQKSVKGAGVTAGITDATWGPCYLGSGLKVPKWQCLGCRELKVSYLCREGTVPKQKEWSWVRSGTSLPGGNAQNTWSSGR